MENGQTLPSLFSINWIRDFSRRLVHQKTLLFINFRKMIELFKSQITNYKKILNRHRWQMTDTRITGSKQNNVSSNIKPRLCHCRAGSGLDWFGSNSKLTKRVTFLVCGRCYLHNLSLKVALPARVNKVLREFAGKDLVNCYGVVWEFPKILFRANSYNIERQLWLQIQYLQTW